MTIIFKLLVALLIAGFMGFLLPIIPIFHGRDQGLFPVGNSLATLVTVGIFAFLVWRIFNSSK